MKTKSGIAIPAGLSLALQKSKSLKKAWDKYRPSCQRDYVSLINKADAAESTKAKTERIIELTTEYAKKHPDKYKNTKGS